MRTHEQFQKEFLAAHHCDECDGKMVAIETDLLGNTFCGYCHRQVHYPKPTKEEMISWIKEGIGDHWIKDKLGEIDDFFKE